VTHVYKQVHNGLPVFDGGLRVHFASHALADNGEAPDDLTLLRQIHSINGVFVADLHTLDTEPTLSLEEAVEHGRVLLEGTLARYRAEDTRGSWNVQNALDAMMLVSSELMVFPAHAVKRSPEAGTHLAYCLQFSNVGHNNTDRSFREFIYLDAHSAKAHWELSGIVAALQYTSNPIELRAPRTTWNSADGKAVPVEWEQGVPSLALLVNLTNQSYNYFSSLDGGAERSFDDKV
jgi:hypothetical protein